MTREFYAAPFRQADGSPVDSSFDLLTSRTSRYGVNLTCEEPITWTDQFNFTNYNSSWGCQLLAPSPQVIAIPAAATQQYDDSRRFATLFVGHANDDGNAQYSLDERKCPSNTSSFFVEFMQSLVQVTDLVNMTTSQAFNNTKITSRWCRAHYYVQDIELTVSENGFGVLGYRVLENPRPLPKEVFNTSDFEAAMSQGTERNPMRTLFPTSNWPDQTSFVANMPINLQTLPRMAPFAIGSTQRSAVEYLDGDLLADSYQRAFQILFARTMAEVFPKSLNLTSKMSGQRQFTTQAIIVVPVFAYIAQGLLATTILLILWLLIISTSRTLNLTADPSTIQELMRLTADSHQLLDTFKSEDASPNKNLVSKFNNSNFSLEDNLIRILAEQNPSGDGAGIVHNSESDLQGPDEAFHNDTDRISGKQPYELSLKVGITFLVFLLALAATLALLFWRSTIETGTLSLQYVLCNPAYLSGLKLPSQNRFVRQFLQNYLPTALGTLIEPLWLVLNRHLCILEPFDRLRRGDQHARTSIAANYNSLPPQFVFFKAIRRRHFLLATVCFMSLLAHLFAIAASGMFFESFAESITRADFTTPYAPKFKPLNGSDVPFIPNNHGIIEPFYVMMSNETSHTPLPPWTDPDWFYMPFNPLNSSLNTTWNYESSTTALRGQLSCSVPSYNFTLFGRQEMTNVNNTRDNQTTNTASYAILRTSHLVDGRVITCRPRFILPQTAELVISGGTGGRMAFEVTAAMDAVENSTLSDGEFCREHIVFGWIRANGTQGNDTLSGEHLFQIDSYNSTIITCRAQVQRGLANVIVDSAGHVLTRVSVQNITTGVQDLFGSRETDLLGQMQQFTADRNHLVVNPTWHNDSLPSDFNQYLLSLAMNSTTFLDPQRDPPTPQSMVEPVTAQYSTLFAVVIGRNIDLLLEKADASLQTSGYVHRPEIKIFMSKSLFIIAEAILGLYIIVVIVLYCRRPWKILVRLPTSIAAILAYFAASHVVEDFRTQKPGEGEIEPLYLQRGDPSYGFGTFVGTDSKVHIGIEKHPYLAGLRKSTTTLTWKTTSSGDESWWKKVEFQSSKVKEGGWL